MTRIRTGQAFMRLELADEYIIFVDPVVLCDDKRVFPDIPLNHELDRPSFTVIQEQT